MSQRQSRPHLPLRPNLAHQRHATIDGDKLDDVLEDKAASIETSGGTASTSLAWTSLKADFDTVFTSTIDLLLHPPSKTTSSSSPGSNSKPASPPQRRR